MKFHPILFSTEMVKAILEGRKQMTRRSITHDKVNVVDPSFAPDWDYIRFFDGHAKFCEVNNHINEVYVKCPYGEVGDVLWVRESWRTAAEYESKPDYSVMSSSDFVYKADLEWHGPFKPSIHMPKTACRIFLKIKSIRVERLQDINEADAVAEGIKPCGPPFDNVKKYGWRFESYTGNSACLPIASFQTLWQSINGYESWNSNPWVWVIEFEQISKPQNFLQ